MERGGPRHSACIDANTLKAYSITVTLSFFGASVASDRRTASADGSPSLILSLPDSTTVEQPAAPLPRSPTPALPTLHPPLGLTRRATCHTPTSAFPALAASSYPIPVRLPSPSNSAHVPHASRSHQYIHTCPTRLPPIHTHHAVHYTLFSCNATAPATVYLTPQSLFRFADP